MKRSSFGVIHKLSLPWDHWFTDAVYVLSARRIHLLQREVVEWDTSSVVRPAAPADSPEYVLHILRRSA